MFKQVNEIKICLFTIFPQDFYFLRSISQTLISQSFVSQIFNSVNPFVSGGTKGHTYLKNLHLKAAGLFKDV